MKKLIINIIALTGIIGTLLVTSCSVQYRQKHMHRYPYNRYNSHYHDGHYYEHNDPYQHPRRY